MTIPPNVKEIYLFMRDGRSIYSRKAKAADAIQEITAEALKTEFALQHRVSILIGSNTRNCAVCGWEPDTPFIKGHSSTDADWLALADRTLRETVE